MLITFSSLFRAVFPFNRRSSRRQGSSKFRSRARRRLSTGNDVEALEARIMLALPTGITSDAMYQNGYLDVMAFAAHYGITNSTSPTGTQINNNTAGLTTAIEDARANKLVTYLRSGTYVVNNTIIGLQPQPNTTGATTGPTLVGPEGGTRPVIKLADNTFTSAFTTTNNLQPVIRFYNDYDTGLTGASSFAFGFNVRNLTIDMGQGNRNSVGLVMASTQYCSLQNVNIIAGDGPGGFTDAWGGIMGIPSSGSTVANIEVTGGQYGMYFGNPTAFAGSAVTNVRLLDQETAAIYKSSGWFHLTLAGFEIQKDSGPVITLPNNTSQPRTAAITLIDGKITVGGSTTYAIDNSAAESIYMRNVYFSGATNVLKSGTQPAIAASGSWTRVDEYAYADPENHTNAGGGKDGIDGRGRIYTSNGSSTPTELPEVASVVVNAAAPPSYLLSQHALPDLPDIRTSTNIINVKAAPYNATGNGTTDDWYAIQTAINDGQSQGKAVFLPKGTYLITQPLTLQENTVIFGATNMETVVKGPHLSTDPAWTATSSPYLITTVNSATATTYMADINVDMPVKQAVTPDIIGDPNRVPWLEMVRWQAGKNSVVANLGELGIFSWSTYLPSNPTLAAGVSQQVLITGNGGGRWFGSPITQVGNSIRGDYAGLRISGTSQPLTIYGLNIERPANKSQTTTTNPNDEPRIVAIENSSNVRILNFKTEHRDQTVFEVYNSDNIWIDGLDGNGGSDAVSPLVDVRNDSNGVLVTMVGIGREAGTGEQALVEDRGTYGKPYQTTDFKIGLNDLIVMYQLGSAFDNSPFIPAPTNTAPTISDITNRTINEDSSTGAISFTIGDAQTAPGSLIVTASSSNTTLVPNNPINLVLGGSGASRTINVIPAANQFGTTTITVTVSDGTLTTTDTFVLTVNSVNDAPTITNITDRTIVQNTSTGAISFTIGDVETAAGSLTVTATSSNTTLVPNNSANLVLGGSGANRTLNVIPALGQTGTSTITVTVSDGTTTTSDTFLLTVSSSGVIDVNIVQTATAPTLGGSVDAIWSTAVTKTIGNLVGGSISGSSDLSGSFRTLWDSTNLYVLVEVTDDTQVNDSGTATYNDDSVEVFIDANKDAPGTGYGSTDHQFRFTWNGSSLTIARIQAGVSQTVTGVSAQRVAVTGGYFIEASITWAALGQSSVVEGAQLGLDVYINDDDDGGARDANIAWFNTLDTAWNTASAFGRAALVAATNTAPTITDITNKTINQGNSTGAISFTIGDLQTSASSLIVTASSSNTSLVPNNSANLVLGGSGANRTLNVIPIANQSGTSTITVTVDDGALTTTDTFLLTVNIAGDITIVRTTTAPTLGGSIDSVWNNAVTKTLGNLVGGSVSGSSDLSGSFRTLWDSTNLYILVEVTDDTQVNDSGTATYNDDSVEVFIDANKDAPSTGYGSTDHQFRFTWNGSSLTIARIQAGASQTVTGVSAQRVAVTGGYFIEASITWAALGQSSVTAGAQLGLDVYVNDDDDGGARDANISWYNPLDTAWNTASTFATAYLAAPQLAATTARPGSGGPTLTESALQPIIVAAMSRWQLAGADISALAGLQFQITDLPGNVLGLATGNTIYIDTNAAGHGWYVDATPDSDDEFERGRPPRGMDLLSVVTHEIGHVLGLDHDDASDEEDAMVEELHVGERRVPEAAPNSSNQDFRPWWYVDHMNKTDKQRGHRLFGRK
ncbi:sugar-binding protein [Planctomicrobium sp. SH664]|uniref:sugar-binding protein n=1 Tax=Planctomicrobium sp. SH664 TaxID=3448125 RepID=UPI003F5C50BD